MAKDLDQIREQATARKQDTRPNGDGLDNLDRSPQAHENQGDGRASRAMSDRSVTESRTLSNGDRLQAFRQSFFQTALPNLPTIPGFHLCWLTTTNPRDTIQSRVRLGYELLHSEEIAGWEHSTQRSGEYTGCVMVNEMIAAKIPEDLYQMFMAEVHHNEPDAQEEALARTMEDMQEEARANKGKVVIDNDMAEIHDRREAPQFT